MLLISDHSYDRFTLYSPADLDKLYVRGEMALVHPNGRIVYVGVPETRADGVEVGSKVHLTDQLASCGTQYVF